MIYNSDKAKAATVYNESCPFLRPDGLEIVSEGGSFLLTNVLSFLGPFFCMSQTCVIRGQFSVYVSVTSVSQARRNELMLPTAPSKTCRLYLVLTEDGLDQVNSYYQSNR